MKSPRIIKAVLLAPLSVYPFFVVLTLFFDPFWSGLVFGIYAVAVAYIGMIIIGIPSIYLCCYFRATRWWQLTLVGAIGGASVGLLENQPFYPTLIFGGAGFGAAVAATAWLFAFRPPKEFVV